MDSTTIEGQITSYLKDGEIISWIGRPKAGFLIRELDRILIPMTIILTGFTFILDVIVINYKAAPVFFGFAILLSGLSLYMGIFRFLEDAIKRKNTGYCMTNKRIMVIRRKGKKVNTAFLSLSEIKNLVLHQEKDGYGHIILNNDNPVQNWLFGTIVQVKGEVGGFENIANAADVYALVEKHLIKNKDLTENLSAN